MLARDQITKDLRKVIVKLNGRELLSIVSVRLEYSLTNLTTRQFTVSFDGFTDEFVTVNNLLKDSDTNVLDIYLINTDATPNFAVHFLRGYVPYANLMTSGDINGFTWSLGGYDRFGALHVSEIVRSAFPNAPINIQDFIGNILDELQFTRLMEYHTFDTGNGTVTSQPSIDSSGAQNSVPSSIKQGATKGRDLINVSPNIPASSLNFPADSSFPRPNNMASIKADEFILNLLQLKNLYLLSDGISTLNLLEPGKDSPVLPGNLTVEYGNPLSRVTAYGRGDGGTSRFMKGMPSYSTICIAQNSLGSSIGNGTKKGGAIYSMGTAIDNRAIPNFQSVHILQNIPATQAQLAALAQVIANTRRSLKDAFNYKINGTFFADRTTLYAPNQLISLNDKIHDYQGEMLIDQVIFEYDVTQGASSTIRVMPQGSFSYLNAEELIKDMKKRQPKKTKKSPKRGKL